MTEQERADAIANITGALLDKPEIRKGVLATIPVGWTTNDTPPATTIDGIAFSWLQDLVDNAIGERRK